MKVFEFAKEIGIETLNLMDKIREWKLPIKSHMATLDDDMMVAIRDRLREESDAIAASQKPKKAAAKKKTVGAQTKTTAVKKPVKKKATVVAKVVKAKDVATDKIEEKSEEKLSTKKKTTVKKAVGVIRRKASEVAAAQAAAEAEAAQVVSHVSPQTTATDSGENRAASVEVEGNSKPEVKRTNIVGRMDLSRVVRPPAASVQGAVGNESRMRQPATGPRNLRTGFFATPFLTEDPQIEEEKKLREEKKKRPTSAKEEVKQDFNAADFRKREVIFQPKKKKVSLKGDSKKTQITTPKASKRVIKVEKAMTVADLAVAMGIKAPALIKKLVASGVMANINMQLDFDTIALTAPEFGFEAENIHKTHEQLVEEAAFGDLNAEKIIRAPVVTVMGHVDHGKTSLLDAIRSANVASKEAGGITQHIGAYKVKVESGHEVTFLDTPGHEAFTLMRARGANVTDIAIIVVAADDGVMPQTAEAINHAKAAQVPIIIAVNKMDKPGANVERIKQQLTEYEIVPEEWGGSNIFVEVSALKGTGIKELLEQILLVAEVENLTANPKRSATGTIVEARLEKGRGPVATVLIKDGSVKIGDNIVVGEVVGRVRAMINDRGEQVKTAGPSDPIEILGLSESAVASDRFDVVQDEDTARRIAEARKMEMNKPKATGKDAVTLEELFAKVKAGSIAELNVVLKADVSGSLEAIRGMLDKAATDEVKVKLIHTQVGGISETDVMLASTSGGLVLGFNVRPDSAAMKTAKERNIEIKTYTIIYELLDDVKKAMAGKLKPTLKEVVNGRAEVREVFSVPKVGHIAGCSVTDGKVHRGDQCRLIRAGTIVYEGKLSSLKRFKDDAKEVATGFECGIGIENYNDIKPGDIIEAFVIEEIAKEL